MALAGTGIRARTLLCFLRGLEDATLALGHKQLELLLAPTLESAESFDRILLHKPTDHVGGRDGGKVRPLWERPCLP